MRDLDERLRIRGEMIEEIVVEDLVDETGARTLQLMRHAASAENHHAQIPIEAVDRLADRLAEHEAAMPGRRRILNDIDTERDDLEGPFLGLTAEQRQGHGEPVIDLHLVDDGEIEFIENDRLRDMPSEI